MKVTDSLYKTKEELQTYIHQFEKEMGPKGEHRMALKDYKINMHWETHLRLLHGGLTYLEMAGAKQFDMSILKGKL